MADKEKGLTGEEIAAAADQLASIVAYAHGDTPIPVLPQEGKKAKTAVEAYQTNAASFVQACLTAFQDEQVTRLLFTDKERPNELVLAHGGSRWTGEIMLMVRKEEQGVKPYVAIATESNNGRPVIAGSLEELFAIFPDYSRDSWEGPEVTHARRSGHDGHGWGHNWYFHPMSVEEIVNNTVNLEAFVEGIGIVARSLRDGIIKSKLLVPDVDRLENVATAFEQGSNAILDALSPQSTQRN